MPNLPKPRLRRTARRGDLVSAPAPAEPQKPNVEQIDSCGLRWVNIESTGTLERVWLEENFDFHALEIEDVLSRNQRPKIDVYDDYLFIVLHFPIFDPAAGLNRFTLLSDLWAQYGDRFIIDLSYLQAFRAIPDGATYEQVFTGHGEIADPNSWLLGEDNAFRGSGTLGMALRRYSEGRGFTPREYPENPG